jgi:hypothetical protein
MRKPALDLSGVVRHPCSIVSALPLLLLFSVAANAESCVIVNHDDNPRATVSGRITTHHKLPKGAEGRTGDGPWLTLDPPLRAAYFPGECEKWRKIAIMGNDASIFWSWSAKTDRDRDAYSQLRKLAGQRVTITGKLGRFTSALVFPSMFIEIESIEKD